MSAVDILIICCGIYILYQAVVMKTKGEIPEGVLITKGTQIPAGADVAGFIQDMLWKTVLLGLLACGSGAFSLLADQMASLSLFSAVVTLVFCVILVVFIVWTRKAQKKYLGLS
jgi:hypothetical protein